MAYYNCLLFDTDDTLLDFGLSQRKAFTETLEHFELPADSATQEIFFEIERAGWKAFSRGEIKKERLLTDRFVRFLKQIGQEGNAVDLNRYYLDRLAEHADTIPGAEEMLREVAEVATLAVISNGVEKVQANRLKASGFDRYMDEIFISEQMGVSKPAGRFFEKVLTTLGIENREKVLVIGDDLEADIKGGNHAGLSTCWVNLSGAENNTDIQPKYVVNSYEELYPIIMEPEELQNVGVKNRKHANDAV